MVEVERFEDAYLVFEVLRGRKMSPPGMTLSISAKPPPYSSSLISMVLWTVYSSSPQRLTP
jgi:hypothetical protein